MSASGGASQFSDTNCGGYGYSDPQLAKDTFAGLATNPFVFECMDTGYTGPSSFPDCNTHFTTLCIGTHSDQHACTVSINCHVVDWSGTHATPCNASLMQFTSVQPAGLNTPCCNSEFCSQAVSQPPSNPLGSAQTTCSDKSSQLWLCVNDGSSAECVNTNDRSICSGNYTTPSGTGTVKTSGNPTQFSFPTSYTFPTTFSTPTGFVIPSTSTNFSSGTGGVETKSIIIGVVTSVVGVGVLVGLLLLLRRRRRSEPVHHLAHSPPVVSPPPISGEPVGHWYQGYTPVQTTNHLTPINQGSAGSSGSEPSNTIMDSNLNSVGGNMNTYNKVTVQEVHYHTV